MPFFSVISAADAPITKDFTKITLPDGTVEVVRKIAYIDPKLDRARSYVVGWRQ